MTKDIQFNRLKAYNLTDLVEICLDDSKLYTRRCMDVSHNRNYHLFTNQKCRYLFNEIKIKTEQIMQLSGTKFLVPSETIEDKLYRVDMETGLCECFQGFLKGPCKHKAAVAKKYKVKNFDVLPQENEKMRSFYYFLGTGINRDESWFRPLVDETSFPEIDWSDNTDQQNSNLSDTENTNDDEPIIVSPESDPSFDCNRDIDSMRTIKRRITFRRNNNWFIIISIFCIR